MKKLIIAIALAAIAGAGFAAGVAETSDQIKAGKITVGGKKSLGEDERFHNIHTDPMDLPCSTCHVRDLGDRYLLLRKDDKLPSKNKGPVDRSACLACHKKGGPATVFYGPAGK